MNLTRFLFLLPQVWRNVHLPTPGAVSSLRSYRLMWVLVLAIATVIGSVHMIYAADVVISEFMASNTASIQDEDGESVDWIEVHNRSTTEVNLAGWYLTDDAAQLAKWKFPAVVLPADGYLVVFASGKNRVSNPAKLHTNFQLNSSGGFLALVNPDGITQASSFKAYPAMPANTTFGEASRSTEVDILEKLAGEILIPDSPVALSAAWNYPQFQTDASWLKSQAPPAIGFEVPQSGIPGSSVLTNLARSGSPRPTATQSTTLSGFTAALAIDGNPGNFTHTIGTDRQPAWTLNLGRSALINNVVIQNRRDCCGSRLRDVTVEILSADGAIAYTSEVLNPRNTGFVFPAGPDKLQATPPRPLVGQFIRVKRTPDPTLSGSGGQGNGDEAAVLALAEVVVNGQEISGIRQFISTDLQQLMFNKNASAFVRFPFLLPANADVAGLSLRLRYDDGYVLHLNGVEIARQNAPATSTWNSRATGKRPLVDVLQTTVLNLSASIPLLQPGTNVFAVQLLNSSPDDPSVFLEPELMMVRRETARNVFIDQPTPGAPNISSYYFGKVKDTKFSVDRGFFESPFNLELSSATTNAVIYYTLNGDEPGPGKGLRYAAPIAITNTSMVRARAFLDGWHPTDVDTATYIFLPEISRQSSDWTATRKPPTYFPATWGVNSVDYGMDPAVASKYSAAEWKEALTQIPTVSIVTEMANLFDPEKGIYANASGHGEEWERPASIEFLDSTLPVVSQFHENCGLRIRGGYSRNASYVKHSLRVFFRTEYGASKLKYPVFGETGASEFDTLDLRTSQNYSWSLGDPHETLVREEFCEELLGALGQPHRRNRYIHLYLNGQYWGIYEFDERPEASYGATYFGGAKENYDVVKCSNHVGGFVTETTDGNFEAWTNLWKMTRGLVLNAGNSNYFKILGRDPDGTRNPQLPVMLDVDNLIDYMLEIFYSGDGDATLSSFLGNNMPNNWFGMRDRTNPDVGFRFFNSDAEHTLGAPNSQVDRTGPWGGSNQGNFAYSNPQWMHEALMLNPEYRLRFADHVQKHFFDGGALTFNSATNLFLKKAGQINRAIRAYSGRWGNSARSPSLGEADWLREIDSILKNWFPQRANIVLAQLRQDKLFPTVVAPALGFPAGEVPAGSSLAITAADPAGSIYYTLDGSDPRLAGGAVSPRATLFSGRIPINQSVQVRARVLAGGVWSPIRDAAYRLPQSFGDLALSEVMYHPAPFEGVDGDEFEFIELKNIGSSNLDLNGVRFTSGIQFQFTNTTLLSPGGFLVLVRNADAFARRYPGVKPSAIYSGKLSNSGETLTLVDPASREIFSVHYETSGIWPDAADGAGFSLVPARVGAPGNQLVLGSNWKPSREPGGSPGVDDLNSSAGTGGVAIESAGLEGGAIVVRFRAAPETGYAVEWSERVSGSTWNLLKEISASAAERLETVRDPAGQTERYYRLRRR